MVVRVVAGVVCIVVGAVWTLQGFDVVQGSFMTGNGEWIFFGLLLAAFGVALLIGARRLRDLD